MWYNKTIPFKKVVNMQNPLKLYLNQVIQTLIKCIDPNENHLTHKHTFF